MIIGSNGGANFNLVINGNGYSVSNTINTAAATATFYAQCGTTTLKNITVNTTSSGSGSYGAVISRYAGTNVILENANINVDGNSGYSATLINNSANITLKGTNTIKSNFKVFNVLNSGTLTVDTGSSTTVKAPALGNPTSTTGISFTATTDPFDLAEARIGSTNYASLEAAVTAAVTSSQSNSASAVTVELLKDVTVDSNGILLGTQTGAAFNVTVNGNGHSVTNVLTTAASSLSSTFYVWVGTLTLNNLTVNTTCSGAGAFGAIISRGETGNVVLNNVNINADATQRHSLGATVYLNNSGKVTLSGTNVIKSTYVAFATNSGCTVTSAEGAGTTVKAPTLGITAVSGMTFVETTDPFEKAVASAGGKDYGSLEDAINAVAADSNTATVIELLEDTEVDSDGIAVDAVNDKAFTINGNGHTVSGTITTGYRGVIYVRKGTVTLNSLNIDATIAHADSWGAILTNGTTAKIVANNCAIIAKGTAGTSGIGLNTSGTIELNNTSIVTSFKLIHDHAGNGNIIATNSTAMAPAMGDIESVEGLTFTQSIDPFNTSDAAIGTKLYATLPDAFAAAKSGDVITVLRDINVSTTGSAGRILCYINNTDVILDGNGKTITSVADVALAIHHNTAAETDNGGASSVVIRDLTVISNDTGTGAAFQTNANTTVTLDNCTIYSAKGNLVGSVVVQPNSKLIALGGTEISPESGVAIRLNGAGAKVEILDATVTSKTYGIQVASANTKILVGAGANVSVTSGFLYADANTAPVVNITGGNIKSANANAAIITVSNANALVNIFGGNFEGGNAIFANTANSDKLEYSSGTAETILPNMYTGASVRTAADCSGIRFRTLFSKSFMEHVNAIKDEGTEIIYGTLITPAEYIELTGGIFTMEALDRCDSILGAKYQNIRATSWGIDESADGSVAINAALVNIKVSNYMRDFAAVGYICFTVNGETQYVYAEYSEERNARSIYNTACAALADVSSVQDTEKYKNPVTKYLVKGSDGFYSYKTENAFSKYDSTQIGILDNYFRFIPNYEEVILPTTTKSIADNSGIFRTIGRTYTRNSGLACDFTCTGMEFSAYCDGSVWIKINSSGAAYFTVYVDGVRQSNRIYVRAGTSSWIQIAYVIEGNHTISVVKQTQPSLARTEMLEVKLTGTFNEKPEDKELFLEFYGDSILNGSNVMYEGGTTSVHNSDGTQAFGWLTAQALGADCSVIGRGGLGLIATDSSSTNDYSMMDIYDLCGAYEAGNAPTYGFERIPDVVVIELGINDKVKKGAVDADTFKSAITEFVGIMRDKYGDVPIVWLYGYSTDDYSATTIEALNALKDAGDANIYLCQMPSDCCYTGSGDVDKYHPDEKGAQTMADTLATFIRENILK